MKQQKRALSPAGPRARLPHHQDGGEQAARADHEGGDAGGRERQGGRHPLLDSLITPTIKALLKAVIEKKITEDDACEIINKFFTAKLPGKSVVTEAAMQVAGDIFFFYMHSMI